MKKRSDNFSKIVVLLIVVTMLALIALSGTYAKYTTSATGTATAVIAKWNISFKQGETVLSDNFKVDLAKTMSSKDKTNSFIQPGSAGSFVINVTNNSQVPATISATLDDNSSGTFKQGQFSLTINGNDAEAIAAGASKDVTINWAWTYNKDATADSDDTTIGKAADGTEKTLCNITLTAVQVDPNA